MRNIKITVLVTSILLSIFLSFDGKSQSKTFDDIFKLKIRNNGPIIENENVIGYYFFYSVGKVKGGKRNYLLRIVDENLEEVATQTMVDLKTVELREASFNGKTIMFKFYEKFTSKLTFREFGLNGELLTKIDKKLYYGENSNYAIGESDDLHEVDGAGFINYRTRDSNRAYEYEFFPSKNSGYSSWIVSPKRDKIQNAFYFSRSPEHIYSLISKKKNRSSNALNFSIVANSIKSGEEVFTVSLTDNSYNAQPILGYFDEDTRILNVMGLYYPPGAKSLKSNGLGLFNYQINKEGKIISKKYMEWVKDLGKFIPLDDKGKSLTKGGKGYIFFHDIVKKEDGTIVAIGEQYRKVASGEGVALKLLLGNGAASSTKIVIEDLMIFTFTPDFEVKSIEFIDKSKSDFFLPAGYGFVNVHLLSNIVKAYGGFGYQFTQKGLNEDDAVSFTYLDYKKNGGSAKKYYLGAITHFEGNLTTDLVELGTRKGIARESIRVWPAKQGYVLLSEYNKKERELTIHLERINY